MYPMLESSEAQKCHSHILMVSKYVSVEENLFAAKEQAARVRWEQGCLNMAHGCSHILSQHNSTSKNNINNGLV